MSKPPISLECPKCTGKMVQGCVLDFWETARVPTWVEGPPEKGWIFGVKGDSGDGIPVGTFRCEACGFLESYAHEEFAAIG